jgi:hypothetical protein
VTKSSVPSFSGALNASGKAALEKIRERLKINLVTQIPGGPSIECAKLLNWLNPKQIEKLIHIGLRSTDDAIFIIAQLGEKRHKNGPGWNDGEAATFWRD